MSSSEFTLGSFAPRSAQDDVERTHAAMAWMGVAHRCYPTGMARCCQPVADGSADQSAPVRRRIARGLAGDHEQGPNTVSDGSTERLIEHPMRTRKGMSVQIDTSFRLHRSPPQPSIPSAVKGVG